MQSQNELAGVSELVLNPLPPLVSINLREKLGAEQIFIEGITHIRNKKSIDHETKENRNPKCTPRPLHHLQIVWCPDSLNFEVGDVEIVLTLRLWNPCPRSIYLHCCGFWDETCRLGAYWRVYPRTRFLIAPGLSVTIYVKATPREYSPIPHAMVALQLAAAHKRDHVVGFFVVPIRVTFLKYLPPSPVEHDG